MPNDTNVYTLDLTPLLALNLSDPAQRRQLWDETHLAVSLQGLVNRSSARLYLRYVALPDDFWWERMTEPAGWLHGRKAVRLQSLEAALRQFAVAYKGVVVWDERVPATSNLAATIAGCDNLLCIRKDEAEGSVYRRFVTGGPKLPVKVNLFAADGGPMFTGTGTIPGTKLASTGSAKCDAYRWLIERYVKTGKANPHKLGYYLDGFWLTCAQSGGPDQHTLTNQDYVIANRGVMFDLDVWDDEAPVDEPSQPAGTDAKTLRELLHAAYDGFHGDGVIHAAGFIPWAYKYTNYGKAGGHHDPVPTEWKYAEILSCFNAYMDADALGYSPMANASFYQHYPLEKRYPQNPKPTRASLQAAGLLDAEGRVKPLMYYAHYVGDYDAAAWMYQFIPRIWSDANRGKTPISWAFNPNLCERFPLGMAWTRQTRTPQDFFIAGDSGAGYLNPSLLTPPRPHSGLPSGMAAWERHCKQLYDQWDISVTGFVIDGNAPGMAPEGMDAYARFSPGGIVAQKVPPKGLHKGMPYLRMGFDLPHPEPEAARAIFGRLAGKGPRFLVCRSILKAPTWYVNVDTELQRLGGDGVRIVDMYTLLALVKEYEAHPELYAAERSQYAQAQAVSSRPGEDKGLWCVANEDGRVQTVDRDGKPAWRLSQKERSPYLYFALDEGFRKGLKAPVTVEVEYLDAGQGRALVEYDSNDPAAPVNGAYKAASPQITRVGSGEWRRLTVTLPDPRFAHAQNGETDLRIASEGDDLLVRSVTVRR